MDRTQALHDFFNKFDSRSSLQEISGRWQRMRAGEPCSANTTSLIEFIDRATLFLEQEMQQSDYPRELLDLHRRLFLEMESLIRDQGNDNRYRFIVVIPVADRPQQLQTCLQSLLGLCRHFAYGGQVEGNYRKIAVVIADDSKEPGNRDRTKERTEQFTRLGLETLYFGPQEQLQQLDLLSSCQRERLTTIVGNHPAAAFHHKG
ncbi:MAG: hypothetical protein AB2707_15890, partial [Candidatus Thiodiazotropha sp.]